MPKRRHLHLVAPRPSEATVKELEMLLEGARAGQVIGLAYVALSASHYTVNAVGQACERPTLARGMLQVLEDLLRDLQATRKH
jgi:hypothetical protein